MVGVEPTIFRLEGGRVIHCANELDTDGGARTRDPGLKRPMLYQLSYAGEFG